MVESQQRQEQQDQLKKKRKGCFRITRRAFDILIECRATAWQIGAYLVLARHTDEGGRFTTSGHKKIYEATGASPGTVKQPGAARRLVRELMGFVKDPPDKKKGLKTKNPKKLIYTALEWCELTGELIPETSHKLFPVTFVLNSFESEEWIWFPNELVDGHGRFRQPLKRLKQSGDIAARLLLIAYSTNDMEEFGGIPPLGNFYTEYLTIKALILTSHGFNFFKAREVSSHISQTVSLSSLGLKSLPTDKDASEVLIKTVLDSLSSLVCQGFLYEIVTMMDGLPGAADSRPIYEIHSKTYHENKGEEGLARRIDRIIAKSKNQASEYNVADSLGRYHNEYPVIARVGLLPHVVGIYRLRFRLSNPKNYPVRAAWKRIDRDRREWESELEYLENIFGIVQSKAAPKETVTEPPPEQLTSEQLESRRMTQDIFKSMRDREILEAQL